MLKKLKMDTTSVSKPVPQPSRKSTMGETRPRRATVEDVADEEEHSSFATGGDADYFAEEDDEGRFFVVGLTAEQKEILNIFDKAESVTIDEEVRNFSFFKSN